MEISQKITEYEQEIKRLQLKIELLRECDDSPPVAALFNSPPPPITVVKAKEETPAQVISKEKKGKVEITTEWIGGEGAGKPSDYYGK